MLHGPAMSLPYAPSKREACCKLALLLDWEASGARAHHPAFTDVQVRYFARGILDGVRAPRRAPSARFGHVNGLPVGGARLVSRPASWEGPRPLLPLAWRWRAVRVWKVATGMRLNIRRSPRHLRYPCRRPVLTDPKG